MSDHRQFSDIRGGTRHRAKPVDEFMAELEGIQAAITTDRNQVWERVADGTLSLDAAEAAVQGVLLPRQVVHVRVRLDRRERARRRRARPGLERALPALAAEPRRRDRLRRRPQPRRHEGRLGARPRHQRRRSCSSYRAMPETHRLGVHDALLHAPLLRGGPRRLRLGRASASPRRPTTRKHDVRGHARPLRPRGRELPGARLRRGRPRRRRRLPAAPGRADRRAAAPRPPRRRARAHSAATPAPPRSTAGSTSPAPCVDHGPSFPTPAFLTPVSGLSGTLGAMATPKIISVDDHVVEPPHVWQTWLPEKYRARGPRVERKRWGGFKHLSGAKYDMVEDPDGEWGDAWYYDDELIYVQKKFVAIPRGGLRARRARQPHARPVPDDHDRHHLRRHAQGLLGPRRAGEGPGRQPHRRVAALPHLPPLLRPDLPRGRGQGAGPGLRQGQQRLDDRGVVRALGRRTTSRSASSRCGTRSWPRRRPSATPSAASGPSPSARCPPGSSCPASTRGTGIRCGRCATTTA